MPDTRIAATITPAEPVDDRAPAPPPPTTLAQTGLRAETVSDLIVKTLYENGESTGVEVARAMRLSFSILDDLVTHLRAERLVEVRGVEGEGTGRYRYRLTDAGRARARELMERSRYVGPAPVTLDAYRRWVRRQSVLEADHRPDFLDRGLAHLEVSSELVETLGPAVVSGRSVFLYGPAGNGKTVLAEAMASAMGGAVFIPHAIEVDGTVVKIFDEAYHEAVQLKRASDAAGPGAELAHDARWVLTKRPVVITGGELTLAMLDLQHQAGSGYYEAPLQVKANGGVFVIDDFGRQLVKPHDLLNRWIVPLEKREDYLTLHTGKKFAVPFDSLLVFATNLNPWELVDEAFLRRIRYKIPVDNPTREQYERLFRRICEARRIEYRPEPVAYVWDEYYGNRGFQPRFCHPRDLLDLLDDEYRYRTSDTLLEREALGRACERYFLQNRFEDAEGWRRRRVPGRRGGSVSRAMARPAPGGEAGAAPPRPDGAAPDGPAGPGPQEDLRPRDAGAGS
jgi:DNA-binding PadR family transcriptional regulator